jgi:hypothetical protein
MSGAGHFGSPSFNPMPAPHRAQLLAEIRSGKRSWSHAEIGGNLEAFRIRVVEPLRQLKYDRIIQALSEVESLVGGKMVITDVSIIGAVSFQGEAED